MTFGNRVDPLTGQLRPLFLPNANPDFRATPLSNFSSSSQRFSSSPFFGNSPIDQATSISDASAIDQYLDTNNLTQTSAGLSNIPGVGGPSLSDRIFGHTNPETGVSTGGFAIPAIQAGLGLTQAVLGFKKFGLAKKTFREQRRQFNQNFNAQARTINASFSDRQRARLGAERGAEGTSNYLSEAEYLKRFGIQEV